MDGRHKHRGSTDPKRPKNAAVYTLRLRTVKTVEEEEGIAGFKARRATRGTPFYVGVVEPPADPEIILAYQVGPTKREVEYVTTTKRDVLPSTPSP